MRPRIKPGVRTHQVQSRRYSSHNSSMSFILRPQDCAQCFRNHIRLSSLSHTVQHWIQRLSCLVPPSQRLWNPKDSNWALGHRTSCVSESSDGAFVLLISHYPSAVMVNSAGMAFSGVQEFPKCVPLRCSTKCHACVPPDNI